MVLLNILTQQALAFRVLPNRGPQEPETGKKKKNYSQRARLYTLPGRRYGLRSTSLHGHWFSQVVRGWEYKGFGIILWNRTSQNSPKVQNIWVPLNASKRLQQPKDFQYKITLLLPNAPKSWGLKHLFSHSFCGTGIQERGCLWLQVLNEVAVKMLAGSQGGTTKGGSAFKLMIIGRIFQFLVGFQT